MATTHKIINGDSRQMSELGDKSVHLIITLSLGVNKTATLTATVPGSTANKMWYGRAMMNQWQQ